MASKFWVGGGTNTNWNSSPVTNWANSSGGAGNQTAPATGDDVTFDNASGTGASVWNTTISLASLTCTNSRNTISGTGNFTISSGNMSLPGGSGATYSHTGSWTFSGTSGTQTINTNGKTIGGPMVFNGVGGTFQLAANLLSSSTFTLTNGTFDFSTFTAQYTQFSSTNSNTRVIKGSGALTLSNTSSSTLNIIDFSTTTNLTVTNWTSDITISCTFGSTASTNYVISTGGTFSLSNNITIGANTGFGLLSINPTTQLTVGSLTINGPNCVGIASAKTLVVTNGITISGTRSNQVLFTTSGADNSQATLSKASGTATFNWAGLRGLICSGGATFTATNSFDLGFNTGVTITPPFTPRGTIEHGITP